MEGFCRASHIYIYIYIYFIENVGIGTSEIDDIEDYGQVSTISNQGMLNVFNLI